jgi:hypothetical protein
MKLLFVLVVVAAVALRQAVALDRAAAREHLHDYRITNQNLHLDKLEEEVEKLEKEFEELGDLPEASDIARIKARVKSIEGTGCDEHHVQCGGDVPECISPLFVCDGHKDCKNGQDEDEEVCSMDPIKVGSSYAGVTVWTDCVQHAPHFTVITITANMRPEAYTARVYVRAVVSMEVDEHSHLVQSYSAKGYWDFGHQRLALVPNDPKEGGGHGILCTFKYGTHDEAECKIGTIATRHECGSFHAERT